VNDIIREHFPISATLGCLALLFAAAGAVLWGALAARFHRRWPDYWLMIAVVAGISVPSFVFAALAQVAVLRLNQSLGTQFPLAGWGSIAQMLLPALGIGAGHDGLHGAFDALIVTGCAKRRLHSHRAR
jgi:ABC-type dipeptide/oligopeptide/nickel transport system permease component